jgi:hypothetical protein
MSPDGFLALVLRLAAGILTIQDEGRPVTPENAITYATAAAWHGYRGNVDPFELVGLARVESDFNPMTIGPDGLDCGMTQTRVTWSKYKCRQLQRDVFLAFQEAVRELTENRERCARLFKWDLTRCVLNSYNSGVRYATRGVPGAYWVKVRCYAEAARQGLAVKDACRAVWTPTDVKRVIARHKQHNLAKGAHSPTAR